MIYLFDTFDNLNFVECIKVSGKCRIPRKYFAGINLNWDMLRRNGLKFQDDDTFNKH